MYTTVVILSGTERHLPPASGADQPLTVTRFLLEQGGEQRQRGSPEAGQEGELQGTEEKLQDAEKKSGQGALVNFQGREYYCVGRLAKSSWIFEKLDKIVVRSEARTPDPLQITESEEQPLDWNHHPQHL